jgi:hypothetical protein
MTRVTLPQWSFADLEFRAQNITLDPSSRRSPTSSINTRRWSSPSARISRSLGDGDDGDARLVTGGEIGGAVKTAVARIEFRGLTKGLLMALERGFDVVLVGRVSSSTRYCVIKPRALSARNTWWPNSMGF